MEIEALKKERLYHRDMMEAIISQYMKAHT